MREKKEDANVRKEQGDADRQFKSTESRKALDFEPSDAKGKDKDKGKDKNRKCYSANEIVEMLDNEVIEERKLYKLTGFCKAAIAL